MKTNLIQIKSIVFIILLSLVITNCSSDDAVQNQNPNPFSLMEVGDGNAPISLLPQLNWEAAVDPDGDTITYQVFLGTNNQPQTAIAANLGVNTLTLNEELTPETTYYWMVAAKDSNGNITESEVASFVTRNKNTSESLLGKWFYDSIEGEEPLTECLKKTYIFFTEYDLIKIKEYGYKNEDCISEESAATYRLIEDHRIEVSINGTTSTWEILSITNTTFIIDTGHNNISFIKA
ncbi:lipocalin family protein [Mariniflexile ostreae]|uniref:Lipocalin family protein n=1 Tax=Mariniflexile ostreae TaxID=1520892 RepID=A0ABV5FBS1_9FLAO